MEIRQRDVRGWFRRRGAALKRMHPSGWKNCAGPQGLAPVLLAGLSYLFLHVYARSRIPFVSTRFLIASFLALSATCLLSVRKKDELAVMAAVLGIAAAAYFAACPLEMVPDEAAHFWRAFEVSMGNFVSKPVYGGRTSGDILPKAVADCFNRASVIDWDDMREVAFPGAALYSPVSYLPQSLAILLARCCTGRVALIYYAGRTLNFATAFLLSLFALKTIPFGRRVLFVILCMPMTLQEMISLSPDSLLNSLAFAFVALALRCAYADCPVSRKDIAALGAMLCAIALCKIVYIVLVLLVYLIPRGKVPGARMRAALYAGIPAAALVLNFLWLAVAARILVHSEYKIEAKPKEQALYVLTHPKKYAKDIIWTLFYNANSWRSQIGGSLLGWLNIGTSPFVWEGFPLILMFAAARSAAPREARRRDPPLFMLVFLGGSLLILTALYVQWTAVGEDVIEGVQGRYFIPLLPPLLLSLSYTRGQEKAGPDGGPEPFPSCLFLLVVALNLLALVDVCLFYPAHAKNMLLVP